MNKIKSFILFMIVMLFSASVSYAALSRVKTWTYKETLSSSDLNAEINNILNNAHSLISPFTGNVAGGGYNISDVGTFTATTSNITTSNITTSNITTSNITTANIITANVTTLNADHISFPGYAAVRSGCIRYKDADEIYIPANMVDCSDKTATWDSEITFQLGSGGSNGSSDDIAGQTNWFYICIDSSAVTSGTELVAASFICYDEDTDIPVWSSAKLGWYMTTNTSDRCVGAVYVSGGSILSFRWLKTSGAYKYVTAISEVASGTATSATDVDLKSSVPNFGEMDVLLEIYVNGKDAGDPYGILYLGTNGDSQYTEIGTGNIGLAGGNSGGYAQAIITTDSAQIIEYYIYNNGIEETCNIKTKGFWLSI